MYHLLIVVKPRSDTAEYKVEFIFLNKTAGICIESALALLTWLLFSGDWGVV